MFEVIIAAFSLGIVGSFHCMGMCGPLALSLPISSSNGFQKFSGAFIYNIGRVITYALFGLLFGLIGKSIALFGFQQWLSVLLGTLILVFLGLPKLFPSFFKTINTDWVFAEKVRSNIGKLFKTKKQSSLLTIGILNGLLPCGLVYIAVAASIATGDLYKSVLFMAFFGMGTLPVMWSIAFFGNYVGVALRSRIRSAYPFMVMLMACLLILRGMGLGIPYVSPKADTEKQSVHKCCPKPISE